MKKTLFMITLVIISFLINGCSTKTTPDRVIESLTIYSEDEVNVAMDIAEKYFKKNFRGSELKTIKYDEELSANDINYYSSIYEVSESDIMCLDIFFSQEGYDDFREYILVRNDYGKWKIKDCGYP